VACRFTELIIDCNDPPSVASFWKEVLGYEIIDSSETEVEIKGPSSPTLLFTKVPEPKTVKNRRKKRSRGSLPSAHDTRTSARRMSPGSFSPTRRGTSSAS
jgi:catechol-2,3-dioxygenase